MVKQLLIHLALALVAATACGLVMYGRIQYWHGEFNRLNEDYDVMEKMHEREVIRVEFYRNLIIREGDHV